MGRLLSISLIVVALLAPLARADVVLIVRQQAEASGNYVRICDIARVEGPRDQAREVANTVLGPTPPKGQTRDITRWDIESRLAEMGVAARISFSGNDMVRVLGNGVRARPDDGAYSLQALTPMDMQPRPTTDSLRLEPSPAQVPQPPSPAAPARQRTAAPSASPLDAIGGETRELIGKTIEQYLAERYKRPDIEVEAALRSLSAPVPEGAHELRVEEAVDGRVPGRATLRLSYRETAEAEPVRVTVGADTEVFGLALVAKKPLFKDDVLGSDSVAVMRTRMEAGKPYLPPNPKAAEGRSLTRNLAAGEAILASETAVSEAVKRGDIVKVITAGPGWEIRSNAKALAAGNVGETINVEDTGTKAKYKARITARGTVSVLPKDWRTND